MRNRTELNRVLDNIERCLKTGREITVSLDSLHEPAPPDTRRPIRNLKLAEARAEARIRRQAERRARLEIDPPPASAHQQLAGADPPSTALIALAIRAMEEGR